MSPVSSTIAERPTVDDWGRDERLIDLLSPLAGLRWDVSVTGQQRLRAGGALLIVNTRRLALTPVAVALALGEVLDRPVRFVGRPDVVPFGPLLRRAGGLLDHPDEVAGALRDGALVVAGAAPTFSLGFGVGFGRGFGRGFGANSVGRVDPQHIAAALREKAPIHAAAITGAPTRRRVGIEIDGPVRLMRKRRGPLAEVELAELTRIRLQDLLAR